jgi:hypothetical protein
MPERWIWAFSHSAPCGAAGTRLANLLLSALLPPLLRFSAFLRGQREVLMHVSSLSRLQHVLGELERMVSYLPAALADMTHVALVWRYDSRGGKHRHLKGLCLA